MLTGDLMEAHRHTAGAIEHVKAQTHGADAVCDTSGRTGKRQAGSACHEHTFRHTHGDAQGGSGPCMHAHNMDGAYPSPSHLGPLYGCPRTARNPCHC